MVKKQLKILGLNPGSKYLGIAVFQGPELRDWRIKVIKGRWSKEKTYKAINTIMSFIESYEAGVIAIKQLHPSRSSPGLNRLGSNESVDVGLERDELTVAVEISVTTDVQDEIQNLQKCIQAGYDYIVCAVADEKTLHGLKTKGRRIFSLDQRRKIRYCAPSEVKSILQELNAPVDSAIISTNTRVFSPARNQKQLLSVKEAAEILGVSALTVYSWVSQRKIPYVKVGRLTKFKRDDLEVWLKQRTQEEERKEFLK